ncbi:MAG: diguanylate cyclase domain-containing protein [Anaerolineae bacterium]
MATSEIREASRLIFVDELTELYNRRFMRQYLRDRLAELAKSRTPLCVLMLDLDGFKQINDTYGHLEGDLVLKRLAQLLREALPSGGYAIRFAGDEFFIFLEGVESAGGVTAAERIRERVAAQPFASQKAPAGIPVRLSLGVAAFPEDASTPGDLIEAADQALYRSKRTGKNCVSRAGRWMRPPEAEVFKRFPCPRLVGRDTELGALEHPLLDPADRKHRFLLVQAHRGLGKSRLLSEAKQRAEARRLRCFFGRSLQSHRAIPYSSLTPVLAECLAREPANLESVRSRLPGPTVTELGTIIPGLATADAHQQPLAPENRRSLLFHGMGDLLCLLSERTPLVLFLDDIHWVDEASLEVLYRLLDRDEGCVVVYAAGQSEALAQQDGAPASVLRLFNLLDQSPNFSKVSLAPLTPPEVTQMLAAILQRHTTSPVFFERLAEASGGIPLFVEETLKGLIAKGVLKAAEGVWNLDAVEPATIPASLEAAVLERLKSLDQETHAMISKAVVVGPHVDLTLLAGVLGKDPGETQQLVDQGKKHRVFEEAGPLADEEEVRFLNQCFQQIVYDDLPRDHRRRTHGVVGEVAEQLAGPQVEGVLGPLAYHFERSDDPAKAEFYRRQVQEVSGQLFSVAEVARELDLTVGAVKSRFPLDERTFPLAERCLRALTVALKNMRVYPEGSQLVADGVAATTATLLELLGRVEAVTFAEEGQALLANGQPLESKGLLGVVQELLQLYTNHGIRRCTFARGITHSDVLGLLKIFSGPSQDIQHDVSFWEQRLKSAGIGHVHIFPVIYLAAGDRKSAWRRERAETRLDDPTLVLVRDVLRSLAATVDNIRLYPPESELITLTLDQLERHSQALFARLPSLTVALAEGTIVVNATRPSPRHFGITIDVLQRLMEDSGLTSLTIRRGVSREDFRGFLSQLAQPFEEGQGESTFWRSALEHRGITTIEVGTRMYAAAARLERGEVPEPGAPLSEIPPETASEEVPGAERMLQRVGQWLKEPLGTFLEEQVQEEIPPALEALRDIGREDLARQLIQRTLGALAETEGSLRHKAAQGLLVSLRGVEETSVDWLLGLVLEPLADAVRKETTLEAFEGEIALSGAILKRLLDHGDLARGARLAEALQGPSPRRREPEEPVEAIRTLVGSLGASLFRLVLDGEDAETSRVAAMLLRAQGSATVHLLTEELARATSVEKACRIVAVLDAAAPVLGSEFFSLLAHPEVEVRAEMARTLTRLPREQAVRFLRQALQQPKPEVVVGAIECVRGLGGVQLIDSMIRLLKNPPNEHVLRIACLRLGTLKDARAVIPLLRILWRRPRFFGLLKGLPEGIRATAAHALGELALPEAREGLEAAVKDPRKTVRSAARLALLKIEQHLGPGPES